MVLHCVLMNPAHPWQITKTKHCKQVLWTFIKNTFDELKRILCKNGEINLDFELLTFISKEAQTTFSSLNCNYFIKLIAVNFESKFPLVFCIINTGKLFIEQK